MFTISAKGVYGLTAVLELALSQNRGAVQIRDIAEAHDVPQHYLEQLLVILKKAGLVKSLRGARGGYMLAKTPSQIKVFDVLACLEGELEIVARRHRRGALNFFWDKLENELFGLLDMSLEELILERQRAAKQLIYNI
ncbi:MAG: Rrf2 family transcriptional regulator [Spirochaetota bacterium]